MRVGIAMNPNISENASKTQESFEANSRLNLMEARHSKFDEMVKAVESKSQHKPIFNPHTFCELLAMPSKTWLLDQVFGTGDIGMIYGVPGCGKTFVIIDMIMRLCTGNQWASRFNVKRCLNVAYCAGEGIGGLRSRFAAIADHYGITSLHHFAFYPIPPQLYDDSAIATITHFCNEWKARQLAKEADALDVLIIDTLHTATIAADENSAQHMGKVLYSCRLAANNLGCAVLLVHHTNKSGSIERGSSALRGAMDFMIKIEKPSDASTHAVMICEKSKDGERWKDKGFSLCPQVEYGSVYVSWDEPDNPIQSRSNASNKEKLKAEMERYIGRRFTCNSLAESIAQSPAYTQKLLNELEQAKECQRELSNPANNQSNKNPWVYWKDAKQENAGLDD